MTLTPKSEIQFAVIGRTCAADAQKGILEQKVGRNGLLSWHVSVQDAFIACTEINIGGGLASVQRMPDGELTENTIDALLETI